MVIDLQCENPQPCCCNLLPIHCPACHSGASHANRWAYVVFVPSTAEVTFTADPEVAAVIAAGGRAMIGAMPILHDATDEALVIEYERAGWATDARLLVTPSEVAALPLDPAGVLPSDGDADGGSEPAWEGYALGTSTGPAGGWFPTR